MQAVNVLWQRTPLKRKQHFPLDILRRGPLSSVVSFPESVEALSANIPLTTDNRDEIVHDSRKDVTQLFLPSLPKNTKTEQATLAVESRHSPPPPPKTEKAKTTTNTDAITDFMFPGSAGSPHSESTKEQSLMTVKKKCRPMHPRNSPLDKQGHFSIVVSNVSIGHYIAVIDHIKCAIEDLARAKYDPTYKVAMRPGSIAIGTVVLKFERWIDMQLACAIDPQMFEGRTLRIKPLMMQDNFPEIDRELIEQETWMKRVKRDPEKEGRCYMVWSEAMDLGKVAVMVKKATGRTIAFKKPVTISGDHKGFFMRAANAVDLVKIILQLDGAQSHRSGAVLRVRPWMHHDKYQAEIKNHGATFEQ